ncbi:hypothetical protein HYU10_03125 [Candidatus Woesearchaeota archaeon]|nr:hypothetical protein [Candidatus Woesearchaeota archaeon]MBI2661508.1 hypothetical protein [Candidatus Woesearchaeota archaeon]
MKPQGNAVFVKINEYKEIMDVIELIRGKVKESKDTINALNELKNKEDAEIQRWAQTFIEIEQKVDDIDSLMTQPGEL